MRHQVKSEEVYGSVTLQLLGGSRPVFCRPSGVLDDISEYQAVEVVLLLQNAHRVTPLDLGIEGFPQWDEYAQFPSGGYLDWGTVDKLRRALADRTAAD